MARLNLCLCAAVVVILVENIFRFERCGGLEVDKSAWSSTVGAAWPGCMDRGLQGVKFLQSSVASLQYNISICLLGVSARARSWFFCHFVPAAVLAWYFGTYTS